MIGAMASNRRKGPREKDLTSRYKSGNWDDDRMDAQQRFTPRSKAAEQNKIEKTASLRIAIEADFDREQLPIGQVIQIHSLFSEVQFEGTIRLCVMRKTLSRVSDTSIVVGDQVRFRDSGTVDESGRPEAVIEEILPRETILTRTKGDRQHPIVANADQMLIVAALHHPQVKWGLVDRMIVAAQAGKLIPVVCLNKIDLSEDENDLRSAHEVLDHYESMGIGTIQTSPPAEIGVDALREALRGRTTVLAGHSGVGKSSLISVVEPGLDIRVGEVSTATSRGMHTTTSARRYPLATGGAVIDTPGVKVFGLWNVTPVNLMEYFPDIEKGTAPDWRKESYERITASLIAGT
jgi:ribosome biogenesis GTPase